MNRRRFRADDPKRKAWQDPEKILSAIGLEEGMTFIDVGCGEGYFALPAARRVGQDGKSMPSISIPMRWPGCGSTRQPGGSHNLSAEVRAAEEAVACEGCADIVFFGIDLHDFADPVTSAAEREKMLRPSGRLIDLDWNDIPMDFGPPAEKRFSIEKARSLIESAGFTIQSVEEASPYHYLITASR